MIYITGDCHGRYKRFTKKRFPQQLAMTKQDYVIICGDFGLWDESMEQEFYRKWLETRNFTLLWVDGNHENYDLLKTYEITEWKGGKVQFINPSIIHLMRGQVYEIEGFKIFTFGGARCHDIQGGVLEPDDEHLEEKIEELEQNGVFYRINHESWWEEEMPSEEERKEGIRNLERYDNEVDYIITHCAPTSIQNYFTTGDYEVDEQTDYFEMLKGKVKFKRWYFGHYHDNRILEEKFQLLYGNIEPLGYEGRKTEESQKPEGSQMPEESQKPEENEKIEENQKTEENQKSEDSQNSISIQNPIEIPADSIMGGRAYTSVQIMHKDSAQPHATAKVLVKNPAQIMARFLFQKPAPVRTKDPMQMEKQNMTDFARKNGNQMKHKNSISDPKKRK